jgi:hypothetical protein
MYPSPRPYASIVCQNLKLQLINSITFYVVLKKPRASKPGLPETLVCAGDRGVSRCLASFSPRQTTRYIARIHDMGSSSITFQKWRIHLANDGTLISIVGLTIRCNDIFAGPHFVEFGFTRYTVLNTESRKYPVRGVGDNYAWRARRVTFFPPGLY